MNCFCQFHFIMYFEGFWSISDSRFPKVTDIRSVLAKHIVVYQQEMELA